MSKKAGYMEEEKEDLRVRRTRKLLCQALLSLLQTTSFSKLTVNDICDKAMVHRATFYNHFTDKNDLLAYSMDDFEEEMFERTVNSGNYTSIQQMYMSLISNVIDFISENKIKIKNIVDNNTETLNKLLSTTLRRSIRYLMSKYKLIEEYPLPLDIVVSFLAGGIATIGIDWVQSENPYTKEEMLQFFSVLIGNEGYFKKKN